MNPFPDDWRSGVTGTRVVVDVRAPANRRLLTRLSSLRPSPLPMAVITVAVALLVGVGVLPVWPGALHLVALSPFDLVADLGALVSLSTHPVVFVAGAALSLVIRATVLAALLGRFDWSGWWFALRFYLVVWPVVLVAAILLHGAQAILFHALVWFGVAVALFVFAVTATVPWTGHRMVRAAFVDSARSWFRLGTLACYLLGLLLLSLIAGATPTVVTIALLPVSAAWTWLAAWALLVDPGFVVARRVVASVVPIGAAALVAVVVTGPTAAPQPDRPPGRDGSLLLMSGIDSSSGSGAVLEIDPRWLGFRCTQTYYFSYAGPGDGQPQRDAHCPIDHGRPYEPDDTMRSRNDLVPHLEAFAQEAEPPLVVIAHSQAAWVAWEAAAEDRLGDDVTLVLLGAYPDSPVGYDPEMRGFNTDPGRLALIPITQFPRPGGGTSAFEPDSPLGVEWLADTDAVEETLARSLPDDVEVLSVPSAFDLPLKPHGPQIEGAVDACPLSTIHPNLPFDPDFGEVVRSFLDDEPLPECPRWRHFLGPLIQGFTVPPG